MDPVSLLALTEAASIALTVGVLTMLLTREQLDTATPPNRAPWPAVCKAGGSALLVTAGMEAAFLAFLAAGDPQPGAAESRRLFAAVALVLTLALLGALLAMLCARERVNTSTTPPTRTPWATALGVGAAAFITTAVVVALIVYLAAMAG